VDQFSRLERHVKRRTFEAFRDLSSSQSGRRIAGNIPSFVVPRKKTVILLDFKQPRAVLNAQMPWDASSCGVLHSDWLKNFAPKPLLIIQILFKISGRPFCF
jgi:hypothetical protein